jgi:hypothetical protein
MLDRQCTSRQEVHPWRVRFVFIARRFDIRIKRRAPVSISLLRRSACAGRFLPQHHSSRYGGKCNSNTAGAATNGREMRLRCDRTLAS